MTLGQSCRNDNRLHQRVARAIELGATYHMGTTTGSSNAYVLTPELTLDDYKDGERYSALANHTSTSTTPTLNISGRGAKTIVIDDAGTAPAVGDIVDGKLVTLLYNEARDELILINRDQSAAVSSILTTIAGLMSKPTEASLSLTTTPQEWETLAINQTFLGLAHFTGGTGSGRFILALMHRRGDGGTYPFTIASSGIALSDVGSGRFDLACDTSTTSVRSYLWQLR